MSKKLKRRRQKRKKSPVLIWAIGAGLLLIAAAVLITRNTSQINPELIEVQGSPAVKVDQEVIDYGYVKLGRNLTFDITVTNVGDQKLRFSEAPYVEVLEGC